MLIFVLILLSISCAGDKYHLTIEDYYPNESPEDTLSSNVSFIANVLPIGDLLANTKGAYTPDTIALPEGRVIHIYIYDGDKTPLTGIPISGAIYSATSAGIIAPINDQYIINLKPGTYNFYALSEFNHDSDKTPPFVNSNGEGGLKKGLADNLDYLWWAAEGIVISDNESTTIQML